MEDKKYSQNRKIKDSFKSDLSTGCLAGLSEAIRTHNQISDIRNSLVLCFRNNNVTVYYQGNKALSVDAVNNELYSLSYDFKHFRELINEFDGKDQILNIVRSFKNDGFCLYPKSLDKLDEEKLLKAIDEGFRRGSKKTFKMIRKIYRNKDASIDQKEWINILDRHALGIEIYNKKKLKDKHAFIDERHCQQVIQYRTLIEDSSYIVSDIEYDQARNNNQEAKSGRFDMIAYNTHNNDIALIELKYIDPKTIVSQESGFVKHLFDMSKYVLDEKHMENRRIDSVFSIETLGSLSLIKKNVVVTGANSKMNEIIFMLVGYKNPERAISEAIKNYIEDPQNFDEDKIKLSNIMRKASDIKVCMVDENDILSQPIDLLFKKMKPLCELNIDWYLHE